MTYSNTKILYSTKFYPFFFLEYKLYSRSIKILYSISSNIISPSKVYYPVANITQMSYSSYTDFTGQVFFFNFKANLYRKHI